MPRKLRQPQQVVIPEPPEGEDNPYDLDPKRTVWLPAGTLDGEPLTELVPNPKCWSDWDPRDEQVPEAVSSLFDTDNGGLLGGSVKEIEDRVKASADPRRMAAKVLEANAAAPDGRSTLNDAMRAILESRE